LAEETGKQLGAGHVALGAQAGYRPYRRAPGRNGWLDARPNFTGKFRWQVSLPRRYRDTLRVTDRNDAAFATFRGHVRRGRSVFAEVEMLGEFAIQRVLEEPAMALGAQIEPQLFVDVAGDLVVNDVVAALQDLLDLLQVIAVVGRFVGRSGVECRVDLHLDNVAQIFRIELPLAAIA
jgi:hypothetical protein